MSTKRYLTLLSLSILFIVCSCNRQSNEYTYQDEGRTICIKLKQYSDSIYSLDLYVNDSLNSQWPLEYPVYNIDFGDVDNDNSLEILVGVIKTTRFDSLQNKRLFIFKVTKDYYIRPKWLGSRLGQPLVNFRFIEKHTYPTIRTIEKERDGTYLVAEYKWRGFGLEFIEYTKRNISLNEAKDSLKK